ncbi:MAG: hypothetical protein M5U12_29310 [Verrucomicrobia bacterium]|nr:hypothetical protein [Verrucomicrobiota bacterium]
MSTDAPTKNAVIPNRRAFLKGLGSLGAAALACVPSALAGSARYAQRFQLSATGTVDDCSLIWPAPQISPPVDGTIVRVRIEFPVQGHDILEWTTFVAAEAAPDDPQWMVTFFRIRVDRILLSDTAAPNFALFGQCIENPPVENLNHSPWGDLTGRMQTISGEFDEPGDHTTFTLLGGAAAGSHAGAMRHVTGSLHIRGPWHSF